MSIIETKLQELLDKEINLAQSHISQGSVSHNYIRDLLFGRRHTDSSFPWLIDDYLSGSYARGTKLYPLDDIDVMMVLDGAGLVPMGLEQTHYVRGNQEDVKSPVHNHLNRDNLLDSHSVLHAFHKSLQQSHPDSTIKKDGQSVNVKLASYGLGIDIVPCFHIKPRAEGEQDFYYIPIGDDSPYWLKTNPKIDEAISKRLHDRHNKKLKGVIKLLKYWNKIKNNDRIRSYHLETIAWHVFHNHPSSIESMAQGVKYFFDNAEGYLSQQINEVAGFGGIVDKNMTPEDRQLSLDELRKAKLALQSNGVLLPSLVASLNKWRAVFGSKFGI